MNLSEILAAGYDPARFAQGRIRQGGQPLTPEELDQINAEQQAARMADPRLSVGAIGNNPQMPYPRSGVSGSWSPSGASGSWEDAGGGMDPRAQPAPVAPMTPQPAQLRDLAGIRGNLNPIDNASVPVPSGTGMIRNSRTGATYSLGGEDGTSNSALQADYTQPIEIFGQGKGYAIKGQPLAALINGKRVDYGVDTAAGRAADLQKIELAKAQQGLRTSDADIRLKEAQIAALPNKQTPQQTAAYQFGLKELAKDDVEVKQAAAIVDAAKRWQELNANVTTGRIAGMLPAIGQPDRQELSRIENFLTMNNLPRGQGSITEPERRYIRGSGPNLLNDKETNDNIIKVMIGGAQNAQDRAKFREAYLQQKGNLLGADAIWQKYLEANPRYIPTKDGGLVENTNRQDIMAAMSGAPAQAAPVSQPTATAQQQSAFVVVTPSGERFRFPTQAQADGFKKAAGL
jgi:hypothetical protein